MIVQKIADLIIIYIFKNILKHDNMMNYNNFYSHYGSASNTQLLESLANPATNISSLIDSDYFISEFKSSSTEVKQL